MVLAAPGHGGVAAVPFERAPAELACANGNAIRNFPAYRATERPDRATLSCTCRMGYERGGEHDTTGPGTPDAAGAGARTQRGGSCVDRAVRGFGRGSGRAAHRRGDRVRRTGRR